MYRATLEYYPNNEVRFSVRLAPSAPRHEDPVDPETGEILEPPPLAFPLTLARNSKPEGSESTEQKPGFGGLPRNSRFGLNAKRSLLRAGGAIDRLVKSPSEVIFLTGTLPGSTPEAVETMARYSAFALHRLKAWVNKHVPSKKDFYCWELQRRGALHLHYAVVCSEQPVRARLIAGFAGQWGRILESISEQSGVDVFAREGGGTWRHSPEQWQFYAQEVEKSVAAYLSKYCGKESGKTADGVTAYPPTRWWGVSRPLQEFCRALSGRYHREARYRGQLMAIFEDVLHILSTAANKCHEYKERCMDGRVVVAYPPREDHTEIALAIEKMLMNSNWRERASFRRGQEYRAELWPSVIRYLANSDERGWYTKTVYGYEYSQEERARFWKMASGAVDPEKMREVDKNQLIMYAVNWARDYILFGAKDDVARDLLAWDQQQPEYRQCLQVEGRKRKFGKADRKQPIDPGQMNLF